MKGSKKKCLSRDRHKPDHLNWITMTRKVEECQHHFPLTATHVHTQRHILAHTCIYMYITLYKKDGSLSNMPDEQA